MNCLIFLLLMLMSLASSAQPKSMMIATKPKTTHPSGPTKQIFILSQREEQSSCLGATGVAAYVVSAGGTNRGLLLREVGRGFAATVGMQPGDVLLNVNNRVIQTGPDADRVLLSTPPGAARLTFVHPAETGLQLYSPNVFVPQFTSAASAGSVPRGSSSLSSNGSQPSDELAIPACVSYMIELINADRQKAGVPPVRSNSALAKLGAEKANDMAKRGYFGHEDPDGIGPQQRAKRAGISGIYENLAWQQGRRTMQQLVQMCQAAMMAEPPNQENHRSNILDPHHVTVGVGVARGQAGRVFTVQEFADFSP